MLSQSMNTQPGWPFLELYGYPLSNTKAIKEQRNQDHTCPFLKEKCKKTSHALEDAVLAVCAVIKAGRPIITCPWRFYENDLQIIKNVGNHLLQSKEGKIILLPNINIKNVGNVDWFALRIERGNIKDLIGIEIQAIDITGTVRPAYERFIDGKEAIGGDKFGINYKNVSKRLLPQLLEKGRCFKFWKKKLAVIVQDTLLDDLEKRIGISPIPQAAADILFFSQRLIIRDEQNQLELDRIIGMSHETLLTHVMYSELPSFEEVKEKLQERISDTNPF
jgi:hypothetical protein